MFEVVLLFLIEIPIWKKNFSIPRASKIQKSKLLLWKKKGASNSESKEKRYWLTKKKREKVIKNHWGEKKRERIRRLEFIRFWIKGFRGELIIVVFGIRIGWSESDLDRGKAFFSFFGKSFQSFDVLNTEFFGFLFERDLSFNLSEISVRPFALGLLFESLAKHRFWNSQNLCSFFLWKSQQMGNVCQNTWSLSVLLFLGV